MSVLVFCAVVGWCVLIFIACCGVLSCCQHHQNHLCEIVRGRKKNSVATVGVFACVGVWRCMWVSVLGVVLWWAVTLRGVDKIVVNAAGFCIGRYRFRWPDSRKRGISGNCVPVLMDGSYEWFAYVWKGSDNGENVCFCMWCPFEIASYSGCRWGLFYVLYGKM